MPQNTQKDTLATTFSHSLFKAGISDQKKKGFNPGLG